MSDRDQGIKCCSSRDTGVAKDATTLLAEVFICATHGALHLSLKVLLGLAVLSSVLMRR